MHGEHNRYERESSIREALTDQELENLERDVDAFIEKLRAQGIIYTMS